jgi:hypothetical protein
VSILFVTQRCSRLKRGKNFLQKDLVGQFPYLKGEQIMSSNPVNMSKGGGDAGIGSAGISSFAHGGSAGGGASSNVSGCGWGRGSQSDATGLGTSGHAASGQNDVDSAGGDVTDNTSIGTVNIGY